MKLTSILILFTLNLILVFILLKFFGVEPASFLIGCIVQAVFSALHIFIRLY